jgi:hypothetical protein
VTCHGVWTALLAEGHRLLAAAGAAGRRAGHTPVLLMTSPRAIACAADYLLQQALARATKRACIKCHSGWRKRHRYLPPGRAGIQATATTIRTSTLAFRLCQHALHLVPGELRGVERASRSGYNVKYPVVDLQRSLQATPIERLSSPCHSQQWTPGRAVRGRTARICRRRHPWMQ